MNMHYVLCIYHFGMLQALSYIITPPNEESRPRLHAEK